MDLLPLLAPIASVAAAILAGVFAWRTRRADRDAERIRALEDRLALKRSDAYMPFLTALGDMLTPARKKEALARLDDATADFTNQVVMWGSDDLLKAYYRFRTAAPHSPPPPVMFRLVADILLAARRDLGDSTTKATGLEVLGMRINDLDVQPELKEALRADSIESVARKAGWAVPW